ncbi:phosphatase PAP2 family protein [Faecalimonas umbilicata]|nr:phosphatase PAP2 family protein [Faecalimonas umbilicata]
MGSNIELMTLDWIQNIRTPVGDAVMCFITKLGNAGMIWIVLAVILLLIPKTRKSGLVMMAALCIELVVCNGILKNLFARIRPCDVNTQIQLLIARPDDFSFPSGHTAASFAAVAALYFSGERKLWKPALILACLIAFSRLYLYVHYPTDILGGILVGIAAGYAIIQQCYVWIVMASICERYLWRGIFRKTYRYVGKDEVSSCGKRRFLQ